MARENQNEMNWRKELKEYAGYRPILWRTKETCRSVTNDFGRFKNVPTLEDQLQQQTRIPGAFKSLGIEVYSYLVPFNKCRNTLL